MLLTVEWKFYTYIGSESKHRLGPSEFSSTMIEVYIHGIKIYSWHKAEGEAR